MFFIPLPIFTAILILYSLLTPTLAAPATDAAAAGRGTASVHNKCSIPIHVTVCGQQPAACKDKGTIPAKTGVYSEVYNAKQGNGISIKVGPNPGTAANILQLEYANSGSAGVNYDVSEVNGNPFGTRGGFTVTGCAGAKCPPPSTSCPSVFTQPTNGVPHYCPLSSDVGVILCQA
ncbi:MAG: hypothetical protein Q9220_007235 [cf. Caloplaca sp. 1 TL-2023]